MAEDKYHSGKYASGYTPEIKYRPKPAGLKGKPEKVWGFTVLSFVGLVFLFVAKYLLDFLLFPALWPELYPLSVGAVLIWLASTILISFLAIKFVTGMGIFYDIADVIYALIVLAWPRGLYGADLITGLGLAVVVWAIMRIIQRIILWIFILVGFARM